MNKTYMNIWGRDFELEVYVRKSEETDITMLQNEAYDRFKSNNSIVNEAEKHLKTYILEKYKDNMDEEKIENIFRYVIPATIFLPRLIKERTVVLLCDFKFDIEHGLAVVFENEKFKSVVSQDEVL